MVIFYHQFPISSNSVIFSAVLLCCRITPALRRHERQACRVEGYPGRRCSLPPSCSGGRKGASQAGGTGGAHPWMADIKGLSELDKWIRRIFSPERVIAGHNEQSESGSDPAILSFTLAYLKDCREAAERAKSADTIVYEEVSHPCRKGYPLLWRQGVYRRSEMGEKGPLPRYRASWHHGLLSCLRL